MAAQLTFDADCGGGGAGMVADCVERTRRVRDKVKCKILASVVTIRYIYASIYGK